MSVVATEFVGLRDVGTPPRVKAARKGREEGDRGRNGAARHWDREREEQGAQLSSLACDTGQSLSLALTWRPQWLPEASGLFPLWVDPPC